MEEELTTFTTETTAPVECAGVEESKTEVPTEIVEATPAFTPASDDDPWAVRVAGYAQMLMLVITKAADTIAGLEEALSLADPKQIRPATWETIKGCHKVIKKMAARD